MRILLIAISLLSPVFANAQNASETLWHTANTQRYDESKDLGAQEAGEIVKSPVYMELEQEKQEYKIKRFELTTGIKATQLKQNTADAVMVGRSNIFPTIQMKGTWWAFGWLGVDVSWDKSIMIMLGSKQDPNVPNSTLISPYWLDFCTRLRYQFSKRDGSSFMALRLGYHIHEFPVLTYPQYISKSTAKGFIIGAERKLAFNQNFGLDMNFDFLLLSKLLDKSTVANSQDGIGYRFNVDLIATIVDRTGLTTLVSLGYGQTSYISNLAEASRSLVNAYHFEQTYSDIHITFTARI